MLDRIPLTKLQAENLQNYLSGNYNIPTHITHASSIYVEGLQVVHHIASGFKNVVSDDPVREVVGFVSYRDLTTDQDIDL